MPEHTKSSADAERLLATAAKWAVGVVDELEKTPRWRPLRRRALLRELHGARAMLMDTRFAFPEARVRDDV
jgi:hypothetical protein